MTKSSSSVELIGALALHYDELVEYIRRRFQGSQFAREVVHDVCLQLLEKPPQQPVNLLFPSCAAPRSIAPSTAVVPITRATPISK